MVQETQGFRQVRAARCLIPYIMCGCLNCLRCFVRLFYFERVPARPYILWEDRVIWKVLASTVGVLLRQGQVVSLYYN